MKEKSNQLARIFQITISACVVLSLAACSKPSRVENPIVQGIAWIGVSVSDIERATEHYRQAFDFQVAVATPVQTNPVIDALTGRPGTQLRTRLLRGVNGQLQLMEFSAPSAAAQQAPRFEVNGTGFTHLCMQVNHNTDAYNKFLDGGCTPIGAREMAQLNPKNPVYYAYARDQDEVMFEIEHVDVEKLNLPAPPKNDYRLRHLAIATPDIDRAVRFYSSLFETKNPRRLGRFIPLKGEKLDMVSGYKDSRLKMAFFQVRNMEFEVAQYPSNPPQELSGHRPIDATSYNMVVFDVSSLAEAKELLLEAGGTIEIEPMTMDDGQIMFGRDLDGNLLGFQEISSGSTLSSQNFKDNGI